MLLKRYLKTVTLSSLIWMEISFVVLAEVSFGRIEPVTKECFKTRNTEFCRRALVHIENFQQFSSSVENYSCQTRLLGLAADVVMTSLPGPPLREINQNLDEALEFCSDLMP